MACTKIAMVVNKKIRVDLVWLLSGSRFVPRNVFANLPVCLEILINCRRITLLTCTG